LPLGTVHTRLRRARMDLEAALARKRAEEKRIFGASSTLVMLPLSAEALRRTARSLPVPEVPDATIERLWRRIQARRAAEQSRVPGDNGQGNPAKRTPRPSGPRLKSGGRDLAAIGLGTVVGLLAAIALADTGGGRRVPVDPPPAQVNPSEVVGGSP